MPLQGFTAIFTVLRLLIPLKMSYGVAKKRAEPYSKIVEELPQIRREAVNIVRQAMTESRHAYVLVNNRCKGPAPLTVQGLQRRYAGGQPLPFAPQALNVFVSPLEPRLEARTWVNVSVNRSLRWAFVWGE